MVSMHAEKRKGALHEPSGCSGASSERRRLSFDWRRSHETPLHRFMVSMHANVRSVMCMNQEVGRAVPSPPGRSVVRTPHPTHWGGSGSLGKAAPKAHALQTLRDCRASPNRAKRLECVRFIGAFCPPRDDPRFMFPMPAEKIRNEAFHKLLTPGSRKAFTLQPTMQRMKGR